MNNLKIPLAVAGAAIVIAGGAFVFLTQGEAPDMTPVHTSAPAEPVAAAPEPIQHPVPAPSTMKIDSATGKTEVDDEALPELVASDEFFIKRLGKIFNLKKHGELLILESIIPRFVVIVDNLDRRNLPLKHMLTKPVAGDFMVIKQDAEDKIFLDEQNYKRYDAYMKMFNSMDVKSFVDLYARHYPLFQKAYEDLGYPGKYFNDRFVKVIEHLTTTPPVATGPIELTQPAVMYQYADPEIEKLSSGQKVMLRMGGKNAEKVRTKLFQLRQALTSFTAN